MSGLTWGERGVVGSAVAVVVCSFLPWYSEGVVRGVDTATGWQPPAALASRLAVLAAVGMAAEILARRRLGLGLGEALARRAGLDGIGQLHLLAGLGSVGLVVFKLASQLDGVALGFLVALAAHGALAYTGYVVHLERGERAGQPAADGDGGQTAADGGSGQAAAGVAGEGRGPPGVGP